VNYLIVFSCENEKERRRGEAGEDTGLSQTPATETAPRAISRSSIYSLPPSLLSLVC